jgi:hypothetical protein
MEEGLDARVEGRTFRSGQNVLHHFSMHIRQPELTALVSVCQTFVVEAQAMQDRCLKIVNVTSSLAT